MEVAELVENLVDKNDKLLIGILEDIQKRFNYLPEDSLKEVSRQLNIPLRDVYGVATFYKAFSLEPRGKHLCSVCVGTACHVRNAPKITEEFESLMGPPQGYNPDDFTRGITDELENTFEE